MFVCECCKEEIETTKIPVSKLCISCFFKRPYTNNYKKRVWKLCRELEDLENQYCDFDIHNNTLLDMKHFVDSLIEEFDIRNKLYNKLLDKYDDRYDPDGSIDDKLGECFVMLERNLIIRYQ